MTIRATVMMPTMSWVRVVTLIRTMDRAMRSAIPMKKNKIHQSGFRLSRFAARYPTPDIVIGTKQTMPPK